MGRVPRKASAVYQLGSISRIVEASAHYWENSCQKQWGKWTSNRVKENGLALKSHLFCDNFCSPESIMYSKLICTLPWSKINLVNKRLSRHWGFYLWTGARKNRFNLRVKDLLLGRRWASIYLGKVVTAQLKSVCCAWRREAAWLFVSTARNGFGKEKPNTLSRR